MVHPHVPWFAPLVHEVLQELRSVPAVQRGNRVCFHPLGEWIDRDQKESVTIGILGKRTRNIDAPAEEGGSPLVNPS